MLTSSPEAAERVAYMGRHRLLQYADLPTSSPRANAKAMFLERAELGPGPILVLKKGIKR